MTVTVTVRKHYSQRADLFFSATCSADSRKACS